MANTGIAISVMVTALALGGQALAADVDFCPSAADCTTKKVGQVSNNASVVVEKVTIHQEAKHGCSSVEKTHTANMALGDEFSVTLNGDCSYNVEFETTSGCTGNKSTKITLTDNQNNKNIAELKGECGTLKADTY